MVLIEIFSHPQLKYYKAGLFSRAALIQLICIVLTFLSPFLIAYFTGGFWIKEKFFLEQPQASYQYRFVALLETTDDVYLASSYDSINQIYSNEYKTSTRTVSEVDYNGDGYSDALVLNIFINGIDPNSVIIRNAKLLLLFNMSLTSYPVVNFESIAFLESSNSKLSSELKISGQLDFFQTISFQDKVIYNEYNYLAVNQTSLDLEELNIGNIVTMYNNRTYGTKLTPDYITWSNGNTAGFAIQAYIRYPPFQVNYIPNFWENFKWGWIQYLAVLIPFIWIFRVAKIFIYENQLVPTIVTTSQLKMKMS